MVLCVFQVTGNASRLSEQPGTETDDIPKLLPQVAVPSGKTARTVRPQPERVADGGPGRQDGHRRVPASVPDEPLELYHLQQLQHRVRRRHGRS